MYLEVGSLLQTEDGKVIDVDRVEKREGDFTVYNFKVEGFHTYFVSDLGILVHNANYGSNPYLNKNTDELLKSRKSYQDLIEEHQKKLQDYLASPDAYDRQGLLANAPTPEIRQKIIDGRAKALRKQIDKQNGELQKIDIVLQTRGINP